MNFNATNENESVQAAWYGHNDILAKLENANATSLAGTPLISILALRGHLEGLKILHAQSANLDVIPNLEQTQWNVPVITYAIRAQKWNIVDYLITSGVKLDYVLNDGKTILTQLAKCGAPLHIFKQVLKHEGCRALINAPILHPEIEAGKTAIWLAAEFNNWPIVDELLEHNAQELAVIKMAQIGIDKGKHISILFMALRHMGTLRVATKIIKKDSNILKLWNDEYLVRIKEIISIFKNYCNAGPVKVVSQVSAKQCKNFVEDLYNFNKTCIELRHIQVQSAVGNELNILRHKIHNKLFDLENEYNNYQLELIANLENAQEKKLESLNYLGGLDVQYIETILNTKAADIKALIVGSWWLSLEDSEQNMNNVEQILTNNESVKSIVVNETFVWSINSVMTLGRILTNNRGIINFINNSHKNIPGHFSHLMRYLLSSNIISYEDVATLNVVENDSASVIDFFKNTKLKSIKLTLADGMAIYCGKPIYEILFESLSKLRQLESVILVDQNLNAVYEMNEAYLIKIIENNSQLHTLVISSIRLNENFLVNFNSVLLQHLFLRTLTLKLYFPSETVASNQVLNSAALSIGHYVDACTGHHFNIDESVINNWSSSDSDSDNDTDSDSDNNYDNDSSGDNIALSQKVLNECREMSKKKYQFFFNAMTSLTDSFNSNYSLINFNINIVIPKDRFVTAARRKFFCALSAKFRLNFRFSPILSLVKQYQAALSIDQDCSTFYNAIIQKIHDCKMTAGQNLHITHSRMYYDLGNLFQYNLKLNFIDKKFSYAQNIYHKIENFKDTYYYEAQIRSGELYLAGINKVPPIIEQHNGGLESAEECSVVELDNNLMALKCFLSAIQYAQKYDKCSKDARELTILAAKTFINNGHVDGANAINFEVVFSGSFIDAVVHLLSILKKQRTLCPTVHTMASSASSSQAVTQRVTPFLIMGGRASSSGAEDDAEAPSLKKTKYK